MIAGGAFTAVGGATRYGLAAIDAATGVPQLWAINDTIYNHGSNAAILSLDADDNAIYGTGYVYGSSVDGNLEGSFSADPDTGVINWIQNCHGDHYSVWSSGSTVYNVSHAHYCTPVGGFFQSDPWSTNMRFATAFSAAATGTNGRDEYAGGTYYNFEGTPSPTMYNWFPDFSTGSSPGSRRPAGRSPATATTSSSVASSHASTTSPNRDSCGSRFQAPASSPIPLVSLAPTSYRP